MKNKINKGNRNNINLNDQKNLYNLNNFNSLNSLNTQNNFNLNNNLNNLNSQINLNAHVSERDGVLVFERVGRGDEGLYTCTATNEQGAVEETVTLTVYGGCWVGVNGVFLGVMSINLNELKFEI